MNTAVMNRADWTNLHTQLSQPFAASDIYWRAGAVSRDKARAQALPYAEPRVYEDRLNEVCPGAWGVTFKPWGDSRIICELTIHGVTRASTGEENDGFAPGTAAEAQAFKRACVKFGLGRYLYDIPISWVSYDAQKSRLEEAPSLAAKFLPGLASSKSVKPYQPLPPTPPLLSSERASAMMRELEKLGYSSSEQLSLAASVLGHVVEDLAYITEAEALEVWSYAKSSRQAA